ncbi:phosphatase PAP2 family protein [Halobacterium jilantaiense]|uniref:PAP2 superfamily protein n=1 Tax=Halobacterium jilantaiense TaxID=355548 RepID=A0A1I0PY72_9EURY|nr:phosphatase PAP2 family protein [Halobacterium jilantaiense]SEW19505.1 PAP2 superfamily protein [Halobacterium jilantaiense]
MTPNGRGVGITEWLHGGAEWPVVVLFALVTQLGDVWFLFLAGTALYVAGDRLPHLGVDRRRGLFVLALALAYVALVGALKTAFVLPRPPGAAQAPVVPGLPAAVEPLYTDIATGHGPGFPSGHALGTTMVWGGAALVLDASERRTRLAAAGGVVALVSLSRLVLGVHYAVDVVVGAAVGVVVVAALSRVSDAGTRPEPVFWFAAAAGVAGVLQAVTFDSVTALGAALGGWLAWRAVAERTTPRPSSRRAATAAVAAVAAAAVLFGAAYAATPPLAVSFLAAATATAIVVAAPALAEASA